MFYIEEFPDFSIPKPKPFKRHSKHPLGSAFTKFFVDEIDLIYLLSTDGLAFNKNPGPEELPQCSLAWPTLRIHIPPLQPHQH